MDFIKPKFEEEKTKKEEGEEMIGQPRKRSGKFNSDFQDIDLKKLKEKRQEWFNKAVVLEKKKNLISQLFVSEKKLKNREGAAKTFSELGVDINELLDSEGITIKEKCLEYLRKIDEEKNDLQEAVSTDPRYLEFQSQITISIWKGDYDSLGGAKIMQYLFHGKEDEPSDHLINNILILKDAVNYKPPYHSTVDFVEQLFILYDKTREYLKNLEDEDKFKAVKIRKAYAKIGEFLKKKIPSELSIEKRELLLNKKWTMEDQEGLDNITENQWAEFAERNYKEIEEITEQFYEPRTKQEIGEEIKKTEKELSDIWYKMKLATIPKSASESNFAVMSDLKRAHLLFNEKETLSDLKEIMPEKVVTPDAEYKLELMDKIIGKRISEEEYKEELKKAKSLEQMRQGAHIYFLRYQILFLMMKRNEDKMLALESHIVFSTSKTGEEIMLVSSTHDKKINRGKVIKKISSLENEIKELESKKRDLGKLDENENKALDNARRELGKLESELRKSGKNKRGIQEEVQELLERRETLQKLSDKYLNNYKKLLEEIKEKKGGNYE